MRRMSGVRRNAQFDYERPGYAAAMREAGMPEDWRKEASSITKPERTV